MIRVFPDQRQPRLGGPWHTGDYLPDPARPAIADTGDRNVRFLSEAATEHTSLVVSDTQSLEFDEPTLIRTVTVGPTSGGTVTVQVQVDGRDIFDDTARPTSGTAVEPTDSYLAPARTPVSTIIEATSGTPTGSTGVVLDTEGAVLLERHAPVVLEGADRLHIGQRLAALTANDPDQLVKAYRYTPLGSGDLTGRAVDPQRYVPPSVARPRRGDARRRRH